MECNFIKVHTGRDLAISTMVLLSGAGLFFINMGLGICIGICGLCMFIFYKGGIQPQRLSKDMKEVPSDLTYITTRQKMLHTCDCMISVIMSMNPQPES